MLIIHSTALIFENKGSELLDKNLIPVDIKREGIGSLSIWLLAS